MKKWTDEIDRFIIERLPCKESCDKTMLLLAINERFGTQFTRNAFSAHLVDKNLQCGIHTWNNRENKTKPNFNQRPLFSERKKKGMWQIKIAEPNVWKQKNVWVYEQANNCTVPKGCKVVFLNSNTDDFTPDNLYMVTQAELGCLNRHFKGLADNKDESMYRILKVKIMIARHQRARENGEENTSGVIRSDAREVYQHNKQNPEWCKHRSEVAKAYSKKKMQDPLYRAEYYRKQNERRARKRLQQGKKIWDKTKARYGI